MEPNADIQELLINAYLTVRNPAPITFPHILHNRRDRTDNELLPHLEGFVGYVLTRGDKQMTRTKYHVMRHIQKVQHQLSFTITTNEINQLADWALACNGILFLSDGDVRDPRLYTLVPAGGGEPHEEAAVPYPADSFARKTRQEDFLSSQGLKIPHHLPVVISEAEVTLRPAKEVALRALGLLAVAIHAESQLSKETFDQEAFANEFPDAIAALTPKEQAFISNTDSNEHEAVQFCWRYEALSLLEWALGLSDNLAFPSQICDVPLTVKKLTELDVKQWLDLAKLRPTSEILDALDLHFRLHWRIRQDKLDGESTPNDIDGGIVLERHYALNWLVQFENADWDDVDTPT